MSDIEDARKRRELLDSINRLAKSIGEHGGMPDHVFPGPVPVALRAWVPSQLPPTVAGRLEMIQQWVTPQPIYDEETGEPTGEYTEPLITKEQAAKLLEGI